MLTMAIVAHVDNGIYNMRMVTATRTEFALVLERLTSS
jgi:hypothetical protein